MGLLFLIVFPMLIAGYYAEKTQRLSIVIAKRVCDRRFKHYYKYVL